MEERPAIRMSLARAIGRYLFQVKAISRSYRIRGRVARTQINRNAKKVVFIIVIIGLKAKSGRVIGVKMTAVISLIKRILRYSAIKMSANVPLLYSVLNPETSSDSPSAKSNGVRFVSARMVANHLKNKGRRMRRGSCGRSNAMVVKVIVPRVIRGNMRINTILTSYEIVWATPRRAPNKAYLELEAPPAPNVV